MLEFFQENEHAQRRRTHLYSLKAAADAKRSFSEKLADTIVAFFGSIPFLLFHLVWFAGWVLVNTGFVDSVAAFDLFPFGLLTMMVSLESIFLAIFLLISQARAQKIADLREEINLLVTTQSEQEITEILRIVDSIATHQKVKVKDRKLVDKFEAHLDEPLLKAQIEKEI